MMINSERIRRDLVLCNAYGAQAGLLMIRMRLHGQSNVPKWLSKALSDVSERVDRLPDDLVRYRNQENHYDDRTD